MRILLATTLGLSLAALFLAGTASAAPPIGGCNFATNPCWNGALVCVGISYQVPVCVQNPGDPHACVTDAANTDGTPASCPGLVCYGLGGEKCYGQPLPQCWDICI
ncbi:MAG: hypothetical protein QOI63_1586 [Thermoplasmata archaeon]|jgi:hypothetical protein|nr:hypothetical protein [Thermoplasmata archaeon]